MAKIQIKFIFFIFLLPFAVSRCQSDNPGGASSFWKKLKISPDTLGFQKKGTHATEQN
jgi:hypothetical protein